MQLLGAARPCHVAIARSANTLFTIGSRRPAPWSAARHSWLGARGRLATRSSLIGRTGHFLEWAVISLELSKRSHRLKTSLRPSDLRLCTEYRTFVATKLEGNELCVICWIDVAEPGLQYRRATALNCFDSTLPDNETLTIEVEVCSKQ